MVKVRKVQTVDSGILTAFCGDKVSNVTIDNGATGNFIRKNVADFLEVKMDKRLNINDKGIEGYNLCEFSLVEMVCDKTTVTL